MGSLKPSMRSRAANPAGAITANGTVHEDGILSDKLKLFKTDNFDADSYVQLKCQSMNEKEIRQLCTHLLELKKASAEEMRKSVYANYSAFIRTSKEISDLEGELLSIRNLLSTQAALIHGLAEGVNVDSLSNSSGISSIQDSPVFEDCELSDLEKWSLELPDVLDVLLAERRVDETLSALDEGENVAADAQQKGSLSPTALASLQNAISDCRSRLAEQLAEAAHQPSTRGAELRAAISALKRLGDGPRAHTLLLNAHHQRLQYNMQSLRPSSTSYGGAYTAALSQLVFSAIAQAANDCVSVFGEESAYASELVLWASKLTEDFALLVKRHALASSAAAGGLRAAAECVQIALGHCSLLEAQGMALCPVLLKLFRPSVEQALDANLKRIEESTAALAAADDWVLIHSPATNRPFSRASNISGGGIAFQLKLSSSAQRFNSMVQEFFEDVAPLLSMQLGGPTLDGLAQVFDSYVSLLIKALPASDDEDGSLEVSGHKIVRIAETEAQQIALLGNAAALADELLPRAALKLAPLQSSGKEDPRKRSSERQNRLPEQRDWRRRLQRSVDRLRDNFCRQHALDLIFTDDGDAQLSAEKYIEIDATKDGSSWHQDAFPSPIFQELYAKLNRLTFLATDMLPGRDRVITLLLMRLTETIIIWLSDDQNFWEDIEDGPKPLGPLALQQFVLDMEFVIQFASQGRYLSRHMHQVIKDIILRAMNAFANTGVDPNSVLPEDDWFVDVAQESILKLSGRSRNINGDREPNSPTASVSAQSMSSVRSHGSS
uniref:TSA: Wollemia nobilis Ref_Wollemi_Transcript_13085_3076 transcribed RNA sequence n=1 Tax=Wollemia nobilis TaxID=56998 RepID=A0A0C9QR77_9CONI